MANLDGALDRDSAAESPLALLDRAWSHRLDNPARSRDFAERARTLAAAADDRATQAKAHQIIGISLFHLGDYRRALAEERAGADLFAALGDKREEGICLTWQGNCHAVQLDQARALECFERSLDLLRAVADREHIVYLMNNLALLHASTGREAEALTAFDEALPLARELDTPGPQRLIATNAAQLRARLGKERAAAGERAAAERLCRAAIAMTEEWLPSFRADKQQIRVAQSLATLGEAHHGLGEFALALDYLTQAQELQEEVGERRQAAILQGRVGEVYLAQRRYELAIPQLAEAAEATATLGVKNETARTTYLLAQAYEETGDFAQALASFKRAAAIDLDVRTATADGRAQLLITQSNLDHAQDEAALRERWSAEIATLKEQLRDRDEQLREQAALLARHSGPERAPGE